MNDLPPQGGTHDLLLLRPSASQFLSRENPHVIRVAARLRRAVWLFAAAPLRRLVPTRCAVVDRRGRPARANPLGARKLLIAAGLGRHAWALALDEPTNHLDLPSIERLEAAPRPHPGAPTRGQHRGRLPVSCSQP